MEKGYLRAESDGITMNRYRLLADAKAKALSMVATYRPAEPVEIRLPGESGRVAMEMALDQFVDWGKPPRMMRWCPWPSPIFCRGERRIRPRC